MSSLTRTAPAWPRFFSLMDTEKMTPVHPGYGCCVQQYFHSLFPHRQWKVFHDPDGTPLAVDVELLYPTVEEPFYLLHTMGMSAAPMHYPSGEFVTEKEGYSELCLILPADWPFRKDRDLSLADEQAWPIWLLMELGRFPHVHDMWMAYGFLLPNTEANEPFAADTALSGLVIVQFEGQLGGVKMPDGTAVELLMPILLYKEEMDLCSDIGVDALVDAVVDECGGSFLLDKDRPNVGLGDYPCTGIPL